MPDAPKSTSTWIKFRDDLDTDPRVSRMAARLAGTASLYVLKTKASDLFGSVTDTITRNALRDITLAGLTRVWSHANKHTTDGVFRHVDLDYIDDLARIPGFGEAMQLVGWAHYNTETSTLTLPNFTEHNAPDKNGARKQTANALRVARHREKVKALAAAQTSDPPVTDAPEAPDVTLPETHTVTQPAITGNVSPSPSPSPSPSQSKNSESGEGESRGEPATKPVPTLPPPPNPEDTLAVLDYAKLRINRLRGSWHKLPHWSAEEEHALSAALPNLRAMEDQDWCILAYWLRWAHSSANQQSRDPVKVTSRRHLFVTDLPANYDRAITHWKQSGSPKLNPDGTKASAKILPFKSAPAPEPAEPTPAGNAAAFLGLLKASGGEIPKHLQQPPKVATQP